MTIMIHRKPAEVFSPSNVLQYTHTPYHDIPKEDIPMTRPEKNRYPILLLLSRFAATLLLGIGLVFALSACQNQTDTPVATPSTIAPTATPTPTPTPEPRVPYVFDLKNFDTVVTRAGESYSIEDCTFLEDGKILITTDYENDIGVVAYIDNLEFYNTDPDPAVLYEKDGQVGQANYYRYFEFLQVEGNYNRLVREEQALIDAFDVAIGNTSCLVLRYEDETGTLVEKLVKKDNIVLKNKNPDASIIETQYKDALSLDLAYEAFAHYFPEDKKLQTYTDVRAYIDQEAERAYIFATDPDGQTVEMNLPISKVAFQTETAISIPETAVDMGINVPGVYTEIYFQGFSSPTYGKEIEKAYIDKDLIYITYKDIDQMTITHVDATQIVDPMNNQLRTCFELKELESCRGMYYNLPQREHLGTADNGYKMLKIGENYFYFMNLGGGASCLVSTRQFNFITSIKSDLDNGVYSDTLLDLPQEVDVTNYILGVDSEIEKEMQKPIGICTYQVSKCRYFEDGNGNLYLEYKTVTVKQETNEVVGYNDLSKIYPAEQFVFDGISLTKFKTEGVPIFDMRQGIDTVSEVA